MAVGMNLRDLLVDAGIRPKHFDAGTQRLPCPQCDDRPRRGPREALALLIDAKGATWYCHRCGYNGPDGDIVVVDAPKTAPPKQQGFSDYAAGIWRSTIPITADTAAGRYLRQRRCALPPPDPTSHLRCIPSLKHPSGASFPALIGLVTHIHTKKPLGLHRTWLKPDGSGKADVEPNKAYLCSPLGDGVIRIWPDDSVERSLGIAEGIETALSLAHEFTPVWCCMDAGHLEAFPVLGGIEALTIGVDNDLRGIEAATKCAKEWLTAGREVYTIRAKQEGHDLNDARRP